VLAKTWRNMDLMIVRVFHCAGFPWGLINCKHLNAYGLFMRINKLNTFIQKRKSRILFEQRGKE
jgi:hypothetical protein